MVADDSAPGNNQAAVGWSAADLVWLALWIIAIGLILVLVLWPTALLIQVLLGGDIQRLLDAQLPF